MMPRPAPSTRAVPLAVILQRSSGEGYIHILRVKPNQLHPTGERIPVCRHCGLPPDAEIDGWNCRLDREGQPMSCEVAA